MVRAVSHVYPLTVMRLACHLSASGHRDARAWMLPPCVYNQPAASHVSCGSRPLVRHTGVCATTRFGAHVGVTVYIDDLGGHV